MHFDIHLLSPLLHTELPAIYGSIFTKFICGVSIQTVCNAPFLHSMFLYKDIIIAAVYLSFNNFRCSFFRKMDEGNHGQIAKLIRETVLMLCKNGICFEQQLTVQGLIGVTVDDGTVFLVHMNECVGAHGYSSAEKTLNNQSSAEVLASNRQLCVDVNKQHQWPKTSETSNLQCQYSHIKQEGETSRNDLYGEYQTTADVPVNTSLPSLQETEFGDTVDDNDVICRVESSSQQTSVGSNSVKHETSGIWNPYSVQSTTAKQQYGLSDYSGSIASNAIGSHVPVQDATSEYSEFLGNTTGYGGMGVTHYLNASTSQKLLQSTPNQSIRMGSSQRKMVILLFIPVDSI